MFTAVPAIQSAVIQLFQGRKEEGSYEQDGLNGVSPVCGASVYTASSCFLLGSCARMLMLSSFVKHVSTITNVPTNELVKFLIPIPWHKVTSYGGSYFA
eukprot:1157354-Pelagomonas_calceolata.AAC.2